MSMTVLTQKLIAQLLRVNVDLVINYAPQFVCSKRGQCPKLIEEVFATPRLGNCTGGIMNPPP